MFSPRESNSITYWFFLASLVWCEGVSRLLDLETGSVFVIDSDSEQPSTPPPCTNKPIVFVRVQPIKCLPSYYSQLLPSTSKYFQENDFIVRSLLSSLDDAVKQTRKNIWELRPSNLEHTLTVTGPVRLSAMKPAFLVFITRWFAWAWKSA